MRVTGKRSGRGALASWLILCAGGAVLFSGCAQVRILPDPSGRIALTCVDPLQKVFRETAFVPTVEPAADAARGEQATFQFVVRGTGRIFDLRAQAGRFKSDAGAELGPAEIGYVGYVHISRTGEDPSPDRLSSLSGYYPDPILDKAPGELPPLTNQAVWVSVPVPTGVPPGTYRASLAVSGSFEGFPFRLSRTCTVRVHGPVIDKTRLWVTNWYNASPDNLALLNAGAPVEPYSERYWELLRVIARKMAAYRQNVALISPLHLAAFTVDNGRYAFDFSRFDRAVRTFIEAGVIGRIEGGHIGGRAGAWESPFVVFVPEVKDGKVEFTNRPISDERARNFYSQFLPALAAHLEQNGWSGIYTQHIADEPEADNFDSYVEIAKFVKAYAPGFKLIEACHSNQLAGLLAVWVPQLNLFEADLPFYKERAARGDEVWFYTCVFPQGRYANRFIDLPLIKTRLLHWINFRYDSPGYLHWGFNFWSEDPYGEASRIQTEAGLVLPAGDSWITYPAPGKLLSSIRLEAMRDGIVDHELLCRLAEKRPDEARELARQLVYGFTTYDIDIPHFRAKRLEILKRLEE
jgi:hypothetical protein